MKVLEKKLKALADKNRLRILGLLYKKKLCVCELADILKITQPSVSKHLKKLKEAGIIDSEYDGFWTNYFIYTKLKSAESQLLTSMIKNLSLTEESKADLKAIKKSNRQKLCLTK